MQAFLWAIAGNTLFAAALASCVWLLSKWLRRRPALIHALWILVLLKLVTPPLFDASRLFARPEPRAAVVSSSQVAEASSPLSLTESIALLEDQLAQARLQKASSTAALLWPSLLLGLWLLGSAGFLMTALYRASRFAWMVHCAPQADSKLLAISDGEAKRLGLARSPAVKVVDACISPLVWQTPWSAQIVLPRQLVEEIGPDQLRLLLAHELAHVLRGDALVRWFALGVLSAHWWNPIVWLAVRQIEEAQEACCDSLVLSASGASPKRYAEMLLTTVDFLAGQETPPPALAAGFTSGSSLKGRCEMILSKRTPFALRRSTRWMLAALGLAILPLSTPLFGQEEKKPAGDELAARVERIEKALDELKAMLGDRAAQEKKAHDQVAEAKAQLEAQIRLLRENEEDMRRRLDHDRAAAEKERALAHEALSRAKSQAAHAGERVDDLHSKIHRDVHDKAHSDLHAKVHSELAKVQEQAARAGQESADVATKLARDLSKEHFQQTAKMQAEIAEKVKSQVQQAQKYAQDHAQYAEKHAEAIAKDAEHRAEQIAREFEKRAEDFARHAEDRAEQIAREIENKSERLAQDAEKYAKNAVENDLPKLQEHAAQMQAQMKQEAEKLANIARELSKNPEATKELKAVYEKMEAMRGPLKALKEQQFNKLEQMRSLKERVVKDKESPSDVREKRPEEEGKKAERRAMEEQLRAREEQIRALQREVEKLRKELGGNDQKLERRRKRGESEVEKAEVREAPILSKLPYVSRLFRNEDIEERIDSADLLDAEVEIADELIEMPEELEMEVELEERELEEREIEEREIVEPRLEKLTEKRVDNVQEPASAIEVLDRARVKQDRAPSKKKEKSADAPLKP